MADTHDEYRLKNAADGVVVRWSHNVPATGTDLLRQVYVLPYRERSCRSNFVLRPVTVY